MLLTGSAFRHMLLTGSACRHMLLTGSACRHMLLMHFFRVVLQCRAV